MSDLRNDPVQKRATQKVSLIEGIALEHLREVGVRAFSTSVVAERAGISIGSIYRYWADTEALIEAVAPGACRAWESNQFESVEALAETIHDAHRRWCLLNSHCPEAHAIADALVSAYGVKAQS